MLYDVDPSSGWYLSSDQSAATQGQSLHADYVAAWDSESMDRLTRCNIEARQACEFGATDGHRQQLPERFLGADGQPLYQSSVALLGGADRTPFDTTLTKMHMDHSMPSGPSSPPPPVESSGESLRLRLAPFGSTDGFVVFEGGPDAGRRQWVSPECRAALVAAGVVGQAFEDCAAEVDAFAPVDNWRTCPELLALTP